MKKIISVLALFLPIIIFSQVPQGISYQALALNATGTPVVSSNVGIRLSLTENSASGTVLYSETHVKTTNEQGLFNLVIGQGTVITGNFASINWGTNAKFLKAEIDVLGGTDYIFVGSTQLLSVPYALSAGSLTGSANDSIEDNKTSNFAFASTSGIVYAFNAETDTWVGQEGTLNGNIGFRSSNRNVAFASTSGTTYAFNASTNTWIGQSGIPTANGLISSNGNFIFGSTDGNVHVFNKNIGSWSSQPGTIVNEGGSLVGSNGNFAFATTDGNVHAYNSATNTWASQSGNVVNNIGYSNGNFVFPSTDGNVFAYNKKTGIWVSQSASVVESYGIVDMPSN